MPDRNKYMSMAFEAAFSRIGKTSPNPAVGAVIVKDGRVVSVGGTQACGSDHAEVVAIKKAGIQLNGADLYVSLEPCCHFCKTPPCTEAIIRSGISRVFIPLHDPNPEVSGKGVRKLREAGIEVVIMDDMSGKAYDLIRPFRKSILKGRAYVIHKSAVTLDGRTAAAGGDSKWITSDYSRYVVHKLRSIVDAVIIGRNTLAADNPTLNVRHDSFPADILEFFSSSEFIQHGRDNIFIKMLLENKINEAGSPLRVVIGMPELNMSENIMFDDNYIFYAAEQEKDNIRSYNKKHYNKLIDNGNIIFVHADTAKDTAEYIVQDLYKRGKMMIMLEGGGTTAGSFFDAGEIDQFVYFIAPKILGSGLSPVMAEERSMIKDSLMLHDISTLMLKDDIIYNAYMESFEII